VRTSKIDKQREGDYRYEGIEDFDSTGYTPDSDDGMWHIGDILLKVILSFDLLVKRCDQQTERFTSGGFYHPLFFMSSLSFFLFFHLPIHSSHQNPTVRFIRTLSSHFSVPNISVCSNEPFFSPINHFSL